MSPVDHPVFIQPLNPNVGIWRYMSFSSFVWIISRNYLHFRRIDQYKDDPYEGFHTKPMIDLAFWKRELAKNDPMKTDEQLFDTGKVIIDSLTFARRTTYVNCWHMNDFESSAMWKIYTSLNESVCIRSSYSTLANILDGHALLGCITYRDYNIETINPSNVFNFSMSKRQSLAHEHEARAIKLFSGSNPNEDNKVHGINVPVDMKELIKEVYVSPESNEFFMEAVDGALYLAGFEIRSKKSKVNFGPAY